MKIERLLWIAVVVVGVSACHGGNDKAVRKDQQYDVVQEGQASGVTSTINAPGDSAGVVTPPITGTGADTTTAFNSTPGVMSTAGAPAGTIAGTLPPPMPNQPAPQPQATPRPMISSSTVTAAPAPTPVPRPRRTVQPPPQQQTQPEPTTTADQPAPPTDTSNTTSTQPPETKTDTTSTEAPPPPPPPPPV